MHIFRWTQSLFEGLIALSDQKSLWLADSLNKKSHNQSYHICFQEAFGGKNELFSEIHWFCSKNPEWIANLMEIGPSIIPRITKIEEWIMDLIIAGY